MDTTHGQEDDLPSGDAPMGEGRNPAKELKGWSNKRIWEGPESSDVGLDIPSNTWSKKPTDYRGDPLVKVGTTAKNGIPVFLSKADDRPPDPTKKDDPPGGALYLYQKREDKSNDDAGN